MNDNHSTNKDMEAASSEPVPSSNPNPFSQGVFSKKPQKPRKKTAIFIISAVILGLIGLGIWWLVGRDSILKENSPSSGNQPTLSTVCDNTTIQSSGKPISDNDIEALQPVLDTILQKKNYRGDVNCNYILMRYYLMIGDVSNAKSTIDDLSYTHGNSGGYSTTFDPPAMSPAALKDSLDVMIANQQATQKQSDELNGLDE